MDKIIAYDIETIKFFNKWNSEVAIFGIAKGERWKLFNFIWNDIIGINL